MICPLGARVFLLEDWCLAQFDEFPAPPHKTSQSDGLNKISLSKEVLDQVVLDVFRKGP